MFESFQPLPLEGVELSIERAGSGERLRLVATRALAGIAPGRFATPSVGVEWRMPSVPPDAELCGFAFTQFAMPVVAGPDLDFDFTPSPELRSPRTVLPLIARASDGVTLLAPLVGMHEQVLAVGDDGITWGWHGHLDEVPAGFATELGIYRGVDVDAVLGDWRRDLMPLARARTNPLLTHLSYWTDNGAAYWYRTEAGHTIAESVCEVVEQLRAEGVPVRAVELDSWFYRHEMHRPITEVGYPEEVPPTGADAWEPRADAFPRAASTDDPESADDPLASFARRLGRPPLVLHARHISPTSAYVTEGRAAGDTWWVDEMAAHPADPTFFRRWFDDAARWGACVVEQDWMSVIWFANRALRAGAGRAETWQRSLNEQAGATGVDLMWCMATPADLILASQLDRVIAVRTCDDYRFADDPALLWTWFLTVNRLTNALDLAPFKDCFFTNRAVDPSADAIDGDRHAELEALLAALSGGPVGIGDRIGRTDPAIVGRVCDDDGRLRSLDRAIALIDRCLFGGPARGEGLAWATTTATRANGEVWTYVVAVNTASDARSIGDRLALDGRRRVFDFRTQLRLDVDELAAELVARDWAFWIVAPNGSEPDALDAIGDATRYVAVEAGS